MTVSRTSAMRAERVGKQADQVAASAEKATAELRSLDTVNLLSSGETKGELRRLRSSYDGAAVLAVHRSSAHTFSKSSQSAIRLLEGLGVEGDAHNGVTVKHRTLVRRDPTAPNLRQVHLIQCELFDELRPAGFSIVRARSVRTSRRAELTYSHSQREQSCGSAARP